MTIVAQKQLKEEVVGLGEAQHEERVIAARLSNFDVALQSIVTLWHIAWQDVHGQP